MHTLDEMLNRRLLTRQQHADIAHWVRSARSPEGILAMPEPLWRTLSLASVLMNVDADLTQPPSFDAG